MYMRLGQTDIRSYSITAASRCIGMRCAIKKNLKRLRRSVNDDSERPHRCCYHPNKREYRPHAGYFLFFTVGRKMPPQKLPLPLCWSHPNPCPKRQLDWFSRFRMAGGRDQQTNTRQPRRPRYTCNNRPHLCTRACDAA